MMVDKDNAIRPFGQTVYTMNTSHSPFLSAPAELAGILADV